jgi:hypothetical protein
MISDDFWTDPELVNLTAEDRLCMLLLLTNRDTNIVGIYRTVWRVIGAGIGWTEAQMLLAARDLATKGHVEIEEASGWVWVKDWWKHNYLRGAFVGNVRDKALKELANIPESWKLPVYDWLARIDEARVVLEAVDFLIAVKDKAVPARYAAQFDRQALAHADELVKRSPSQGPYEGLGSTLQGAAGNHTPTHTLISTTTHTRKQPPGGGGTFEQYSVEDMVNAALWASEKGGQIKNIPGYRRKVRSRLLEEGPNRTDFETLNAWRNAVEQAVARDDRLQQALAQEDAKNAEIAAKHRLALSHFEALAVDQRQHIVDEFQRCVVERNPSLKRFYARQGLMNKAVHAAFIQFFSDANRGDSA